MVHTFRRIKLLLDAPAKVSLFPYDNHTLPVESFLNELNLVHRVAKPDIQNVTDTLIGETLPYEPVLDWRGKESGKNSYSLILSGHSYRLVAWDE